MKTYVKQFLTVAALAAVTTLVPTAAEASNGISTTDNVNIRTGPATSYQAIGQVPRGTSPNYICWTEGQNISGVTVWFKVNHNGTVGFISSYYDNSSYTTNAQITSKYGIPNCANVGSTPAPAPAPAPTGTGSASTPIWVGAPFAGYWAGSPNAASARPESHQPVMTVPGYSYLSDWAMDYYQVAGTAVRLYAAPKDSALGNGITARVLAVGSTCGAPRGIAEGGYNITIGLFDRGVRVGSVSFGHIVSPDLNGDGAFNTTDVNYRGGINRWGGYIGKVGQFSPNPCWQVNTSTGHHVHMEFANVKNYSCFRGGVANHQALSASNYVGYIGGSYASRRMAPCPSGA